MALRNFPLFPSVADSAFSDRFNRIDRLFSQLTGDAPVSVSPSYDLRQTDNEHYELTVSVPGWQEHELEIEVAGGRLTVTGQKEVVTDKEADKEGQNSGWLHRGISRSDFRLSYSVPEHMKSPPHGFRMDCCGSVCIMRCQKARNLAAFRLNTAPQRRLNIRLNGSLTRQRGA